MAGKDDLKILSAYICSETADVNGDEADKESIAATVMNNALATGSLQEAIDGLGVKPKFFEILNGQVDDKGMHNYRKSIQVASKLLRSPEDPTGGATTFSPKRSRIPKSLGLKKIHGTKSFNFYRQAV